MPGALALAAAVALDCAAPAPPAPVAFDAARLHEGRYTYRLLLRGKDIGTFAISIRPGADGRWHFAADGGDQHWEATAQPDMTPVDARLTMRRRGVSYAMTVTYADGVATGEERETPPNAPAVFRPSRAALSRQTVDQRIDWAAMMAAGLKPGDRIGFDVYDPGSGSTRVIAAARAGAPMDGPDGRHDTIRLDYRICKPGEAEDYTVYATARTPHVMLREDMRGDLVSVLEKVER